MSSHGRSHWFNFICAWIGLALILVANSSYGLCVSSYQARLRSEPNSSARVTWVVGKYMPLVELDRRGGWVKVRDLDGESHWISGSEVTSREKCVVVKARRAALRKGPSTRQGLAEIQAVDRYTAFRRVDGELEDEPDSWYWVEDEAGKRFWIPTAVVWRATTVSRIGF